MPEDAARHFPTATVLLDDRVLLASWVEGRATHRLGILNLRTGQWRVLPGLRGMLRDALALSNERALILTDHALTEVDLTVPEVTRRSTAKIGKYNTYLRAEADDVVAVGNSAAAMESLISLSSMTLLKRRRQSPLLQEPIPVDAAREGAARILHRGSGLLIAATQARESAPQRLLVLSAEDLSAITSVDFPLGLNSANVVSDGLIAAGPDIGRARSLTAIPGLIPRVSDSEARPLTALVHTANESAANLLKKSARRNPPRTIHRDHRLEPGDELADVTARRLTLENCVAARSTQRHERPRISRVHVTDLEFQSSSLNGAVLEDVTVDGLRCPHGAGFLFGCELRRVTLKGRVRGLILNPTLDDPDSATTARYSQWHRERMQDPEWMLDLTDATGDITIRGYPSRFIRRNPELQAVVTAEAAHTLDWRAVDPGRSSLRIALHELVRSDWDDVTLIADTHAAYASDDLRYIQQLRALGIARPD
ncbi:hypothetical protein ASD65_01445 [Microbacterium sp. Root61]|uniref:hypothetical protein n=1 Tax=Microbacterium sp. Root61 TaxID=1736570 RepID=UPI0006FA92D1|nr:hypothetical protein [Microbacterium sp. Root61]KRA23230.1 hypothetical protein ASD65_01445 [Microbacterium sp. Root61]